MATVSDLTYIDHTLRHIKRQAELIKNSEPKLVSPYKEELTDAATTVMQQAEQIIRMANSAIEHMEGLKLDK